MRPPSAATPQPERPRPAEYPILATRAAGCGPAARFDVLPADDVRSVDTTVDALLAEPAAARARWTFPLPGKERP
jgi:hypothetical protein